MKATLIVWFRQLIKFAIVGVSSFLLDLTIYVGLTRFSSWFNHYYLLANSISFLVTAFWSFTLNRIWTFRVTTGYSHKQYSKFLLVSGIGLILSSYLLYLTVSQLNIYDVIAKFLVAIIVMFWNFGANKFWTFRSNKIQL
jgi:putative flippase GtrA